MIIFLDFDGVIAHSKTVSNRYLAYPEVDKWGTFKQTAWYDLDPDCIKLLNKLIKLTNAKVVISSTWRLLHCIMNLEHHMKDFGFEGDVIDKTPSHPLSWRDTEIQMWLANNNCTEDYIVLDDEQYHLQECPKNNFVYIKHGWFNKGLKNNRAKWELVRVLRKRGIEWDHSF